MTLLLADLRDHVTTGLADDALQLLLDAAYDAIDDYLGIDDGAYGDTVTELLSPPNGDLLGLSRRALSVEAVIEGTVTLASDDYRLMPSGNILRRLMTGTNPQPRWLRRIEVRYTPVIDGSERDRVAIALVNLDLNYMPGMTMEVIGSWTEQKSQAPDTYKKERAAILASYGAGSPLVMF